MPENKEPAPYTVKSDSTYGCVRSVRVVMGDFEIFMTHNKALRHTGVDIKDKKSMFAPKVMRMPDSGFSLCYEHVVLFEDNFEEFEAVYRRTVDFCASAGDVIESIIEKLNNDEEI